MPLTRRRARPRGFVTAQKNVSSCPASAPTHVPGCSCRSRESHRRAGSGIADRPRGTPAGGGEAARDSKSPTLSPSWDVYGNAHYRTHFCERHAAKTFEFTVAHEREDVSLRAHRHRQEGTVSDGLRSGCWKQGRLSGLRASGTAAVRHGVDRAFDRP